MQAADLRLASQSSFRVALPLEGVERPREWPSFRDCVFLGAEEAGRSRNGCRVLRASWPVPWPFRWGMDRT